MAKTIDEILKEEINSFFLRSKEYVEKYSKKDDDGNIIELSIMPHSGYNFSMPYDAVYSAMKKFANSKLEEAAETVLLGVLSDTLITFGTLSKQMLGINTVD